MEVWQQLWNVPSGWSATDPSRQSETAPLDLEAVWSTKHFSRQFERNQGLKCELLVYADKDAGFQIAIGAWRRSKPILSNVSLDGWEYDSEYCWTEECLVRPGDTLELVSLRSAAEDALALLADVH